MAKYVQNLDRLQATLTRMGNRARSTTKRKVIVGFGVPYAMPVHEKTEMVLKGKPRPSGRGVFWGPHGEARFLENAARIKKRAIARRIAQVTKSTHSITRGLYSGGVVLRDEAKRRVPVEYGDLKNSAYVRVV